MLPISRLFAAACLAFFTSVSVVPAAAQGTDTILILDASGSMWGQVDGQTKISAAKKAVDSILSKWKPADRLGLMAYGHRTKGECSDIELMVPVTKFDPARIRAAVNGLNPKGKTPMADSLRSAATALRATENKATVVLVSDGIETCTADPCAVAADLKKAGVGFTAHVIGFDVTDPAAKSQLQCIARATGGVYLDASNAVGLETALGKAVAATQGAKVSSEAPAKPVADPYQGKNVRGVVRFAAGLDPITDNNEGVTWAFYKRQGEQHGDHVASFYGAPMAGSVEPGAYVVEVEYGQVKRSFKATAEKGKPLALDVVLDVGFVTSEGTVQGSSEKMQEPIWDVYTAGGEHVTSEYKPVPRFILGAGNYKLQLTRGDAKVEKAFTVAAGDTINVSLALDAGKLLVSGKYGPSGPKIEEGFSADIRLPSKEEGGEGEQIAFSNDALAKFELPSGEYVVIASVGEARRVTRVKVTSGQPTRLDVDLDAGVLGLKAAGAETIELFSAARDINNNRPQLAANNGQEFNVALNAGNYAAVVTYPDGKKVEKSFTIVAGKRADVIMQK